MKCYNKVSFGLALTYFTYQEEIQDLLFCLAYQHLKKITINGKHNIPITDMLLDELHGSSAFLKSNLYDGYHHIYVPNQISMKLFSPLTMALLNSLLCPLASPMPQP